jgi:hypothetical protein
MRIGAVQGGLTPERALTRSAKPSAQTAQGEQEAPKRRASHVLLGWRRLEAPLIVQILGTSGDKPTRTPMEAMALYSPLVAPPLTHVLAKA